MNLTVIVYSFIKILLLEPIGASLSHLYGQAYGQPKKKPDAHTTQASGIAYARARVAKERAKGMQ
jgi:hypothetical protein